MKTNAIYESLAPKGLFAFGQLCMGSFNGYTVTLRPYNGRNYYLDVAVRPDSGDRALVKRVKASVKKLYGKNLGCINGGKYFRFLISFNKKSPYQEQFSAYMGAISSALRENGISPADSCAVCGSGSPDSLCFYESSYQPVHNSCMQGSLENSRQKIEQNKANGSYLTGFVGALLGMLVGSLASVLTIVLTERIYAILFALVPIASAWGYRKFNGKMDKFSVVLVILLSFVSIFIMNYLSIVVFFMQDYALSVGEAMWFASDLLLTSEGLMLIATSSGSMFLFMVLGIFIAWRFIVNTNAGSMKNLEAIGDTLRTNPAYAPDGYDSRFPQPEEVKE